MKVIVSFSGGKDSQACLIQACKTFGADNIEAVFCDTCWEHHLTYEHVTAVTSALGVKLVVLENSKVGGFEELCKHMKWFPDSQHRVCTVQLKVQPMIDYILNHRENLLIIQGIRAAESASRSKMPCSANYFMEYIERKPNSRLYRIKDVLDWCAKYTATVERPMLGFSAQQVIDYILDNGLRPNPLYEKGFSRVGCFPCIYAKLSDIKAMRHETLYIERVIQLENQVNQVRQRDNAKVSCASLLPKGKIPSRFCRKYGNGIPAFEEVISYVGRDDAQLELFDTSDKDSCMSVYHGLCE